MDIMETQRFDRKDTTKIKDLIEWFDTFIIPKEAELWPITQNNTIQTSLAAINIFKDYKVQYPQIVIDVLWELYKEYNDAFKTLINNNRESSQDYQYCCDNDWNPINYFSQIDMTWLPQEFLDHINNGKLSKDEIKAILRSRVFEIENSLAMYQLLERMFTLDCSESNFKKNFRFIIDSIRKKYNKPIALLAVTDEKYLEMKANEFWKNSDDDLSPKEVSELSGFDYLLSPSQFQELAEGYKDDFPYLIFARTSLPVSVLKKPTIESPTSLLNNDVYRSIIKKNSITYNIDAPEFWSDKKINDTKKYLSLMNMAYDIWDRKDIFSDEFNTFLEKWWAYNDYKWDRLSQWFYDFIISQWVTPEKVALWNTKIRCKPLDESYWCYGHLSFALNDAEKRSRLGKEIKNRWKYCIQIEMNMPEVQNASWDSIQYSYIHRNLFGIDAGSWEPLFMWWVVCYMPIDSKEAEQWRNHWNNKVVYAEIV